MGVNMILMKEVMPISKPSGVYWQGRGVFMFLLHTSGDMSRYKTRSGASNPVSGACRNKTYYNWSITNSRRTDEGFNFQPLEPVHKQYPYLAPIHIKSFGRWESNPRERIAIDNEGSSTP